MNELRTVKSVDGIEYCFYKPTAAQLYAPCYDPSDEPPYFRRIVHKVRMLREMIRSDSVIVYMKSNDKVIGHLVVSRGGTRVAESNRQDIVIGPIWIIPSQRGKGYGSAGIRQILTSLGFKYRYAFEFIEDTNIASVRTVEKNGFVLRYKTSERGIMRTLKKDENGKWLLYRYTNTAD